MSNSINNNNTIQLFDYNSLSNFQSAIHEDNGLYKKSTFVQSVQKRYQIIDRKFCPSNHNNHNVTPKNTFMNINNSNIFINTNNSNNFMNNLNSNKQQN